MLQSQQPTQYLDAERQADVKKSVFQKTTLRAFLTAFNPVQPKSIYLRDGELVAYRRTRSLLYQCRYKLADGTWTMQTTGKAALEQAIARACDIYDEARYRQRLGLAHSTYFFAQIAAQTLLELRQQIDAGSGKTAYHSYVSCVEKYFLPYFSEHRMKRPGFRGGPLGQVRARLQPDWLTPDSSFLQLQQGE